MALGKSHVLVIVAIAGIMALTLAGAGVLSGSRKPGYVRINVSEKSAVYLEFEGAGLRAATSAEGLKTAAPVPLPAVSNLAPRSGEFITLPIPAAQLPEGISAVKGTFTRIGNNISGELGICRTDAQKVVWQCDVEIWSKTGDQAEAAQLISLPDLGKLRLAVTTVPSHGKVGIGVPLMSGNNPLSGVLRDGKPVSVQVSLTDAAGKEVASRNGPLTDFGFS